MRKTEISDEEKWKDTVSLNLDNIDLIEQTVSLFHETLSRQRINPLKRQSFIF